MHAVKILRNEDQAILANVAEGVFDHDINSRLTQEFLNDPRHQLAVALVSNVVVGMASAMHYVHPDKQPQLWINEVGVAPTHQGQEIGKELLSALLQVGRELGCKEAWVVTDRPNKPAMRLYSSLGGIEAPDDQVIFTFRLDAASST
jgi:ribosomal protein S18 acetylase RimI-like enzyme